ncbi:MAG: Asparagine synthetase [glutamine-hydrolyzing] [Syntrophus sp. SKADARSKE-3]|nr:Asparagine synthetase [glutamine-hydrolyzing] [Syntrophus sp. SKADARSKE-3]
MCGICGKLTMTKERVDEGLLRRMNAILAHRGPDDDSFYIHHDHDLSVGLGHRRLAIIDLSKAGRQPMTNEDDTVWIVFNGEIYNFLELREELLTKGHRFRSHTDTEVLIHLYEEEGAEGLKKLIGMFAFALWDKRNRLLLLARDHIGIKPLVYAWNGHSLIFASEIKAILQDPSIARTLDEKILNLYLTINYIPAPYSIFKGIRKLPPGHALILQNGKLTESAYWNLDLQRVHDEPKQDKTTLKQNLYGLLEDAVQRQMIADVPLGAFLSGGIDSSIIVALMARQSSKPVKTYSIGFTDMPMFDETSYAKAVARMYETDHHEIKLSSRDMLDVIPDVLNALDEPFADSSAIPTFVVSRETRKDVTVALSGDGGDELFAGYRMYKGESWYGNYRRIPSFIRKGLIEPLIGILPDSRDAALPEYVRRAKKFLRGAYGSFEERFLALNEIFSPEIRRDLLIGHLAAYDELSKEVFARRLREMQDDPLNRMLYADLKESLPGDMLRKVDAMSMLNSLEVRVPILDHRVCEAAFAMSGSWKLRHGKSKYILIETFKELLPPSVLAKPKWGFEIPISKWLKSDLQYLIDDYLSPERIGRQGLFRYPAIHSLISRLQANQGDTSWQLWNLIAFQVWYERYL